MRVSRRGWTCPASNETAMLDRAGHRAEGPALRGAEHPDDLAHRRGRRAQHPLLLRSELEPHDLLDARAPHHRDTDEEPSIPYSPSRSAVQGSTRFWSRQIASTICAAASPGAYQAEVPSRFTISPPPLRVRSTILAIRDRVVSWSSGTPPTVVAETTGTIWSPCPPSTIACTSLTDLPVSHEMKAAKRAVSRMPAMPTTPLLGELRHGLRRGTSRRAGWTRRRALPG